MRLIFSKTVGKPGEIIPIYRSDEGWRTGEEVKVKSSNKDMTVLGRDAYKVKLVSETEGFVIRAAHLHMHTDASLLDGMTTTKTLAEMSEEACAITDHGCMYNFLEFYQEMVKRKKKPIIGFEAYATDLEDNLAGCHLVLLAKNEQGYHNLLKLTSESFYHFYRKPHVTWEMLERCHEGIIALSGCVAGLIPRLLLSGQFDEAKEALNRYRAIFGGDFYIEFQRHHFDTETRAMQLAVQLAREEGVKVVATTDSHYPLKSDKKAHEVLLAIGTGDELDGANSFTFPGDGYHIHSSEELEELFKDVPEFLDNTLEIADKIDLSLKLGEQNLPKFEIPEGFKDDKEYLYFLAKEGLKARGLSGKKEYEERLNYEYNVICNMGFASYFLIVWDFINYGRQHDVLVGPGRGSAAGSLLAYSLEITDLDPIKYDLIFERFLNPSRVSMPDIDVDFDNEGREKVIEYVRKKYGEEKVSQIITFGTLKSRMALKDVARTMGLPVSFGNNLSKMIGQDSISEALENNPDFRDLYENDSKAREVIDLAMKVEGLKRHKSKHACGVLISYINVSDALPTTLVTDKATGEPVTVTQVQGPECETLSLLKMDFLGLKNLSAIKDTCEANGISYKDIPLDDRETYKMLAKGLTGGVFQLESAGMTNVVKDMLSDIDDIPDDQLEECFERLIAAVALYRPGPLKYIPDYIEGMRDPKKIRYDCPEEEEILKSTYGVIVYQEQVMQLVQKLAGYSLARADLVRKAMGKKKQDIMDAEEKVFLYGNKKDYENGKDKEFVPGAIANGIEKSVAKEIWGKMKTFAEYAFNRSHASCYAYLGVITAYLSCHYPVDFYAAMLNAFNSDNDSVKSYLSQAARRGITLLLPNVNESKEEFVAIPSENAIRFGLRGVAGVKKVAKNIVEERTMNGKYTSVRDFYNRLNRDGKITINKKALEGLTFAGAFNEFLTNKKVLLDIFENLKRDQKNSVAGQLSLFGEEHYFVDEDQPDFLEEDLLFKEFEAIGAFVSSHPAKEAKTYAKRARLKGLLDIPEILALEQEQPVSAVGVVKEVITRYTKSGEPMLSFVLLDEFQEVRCVIFPRNMETNRYLVTKNAVIGVIGDYQLDEDFGNQIIVKTVVDKDALQAQAGEREIIITVKSKEEVTRLKKFLMKFRDGETPVALKKEDETKLYHPKSFPKIRLTPGLITQLKEDFQISF